MEVRKRFGKIKDGFFYSAGFTLIEVLVVVAIIAFLVAILLPSLATAREQARTSVCLANLHRLGHGIAFYVDKFGVYPPVRLTKTYNSETGAWESFYLDVKNSKWRRKAPRWHWFIDYGVGPVISPGKYATEAEYHAALDADNDFFLCPSLRGEFERDVRNGAYGYNWQYMGNSLVAIGSDYCRWPVSASHVKNPARTVLLADSRGGALPHGLHAYTLDPPRLASEHGNTRFGAQKVYNAGLSPYYHVPVEMRHNRRGNVLFSDGHAESMMLKQLGYALEPDNPKVTLPDGPGANNALWTGKGHDSSSIPFQ